VSDQDILQAMSASSSRRYQAAQPTATASQPVPVRQRASRPVQEPTTRVPRRPAAEQPRSRRGGTSEPITRANGPRPTQAQATAHLDLDDEQLAQATVQLGYDAEYNAEMPAQTTTLLGDDTNADIQVHMPPALYRRPQPQARGKQGKHPTVWIGLTAITILLGWILSTGGASWWVTHVTDPGTYGPMHGTIATGVFGGGDSKQHPTKLVAMNTDGRVAILKITGGDPSKTQIIAGPNLVAMNFPDPAQAEVELTVDSHNDVTITVYGSDFPLPFHRTSRSVVLHSDGKGNLKPQTGGQ